MTRPPDETRPGPDDPTLPPTQLEGPMRFLGRYRVVRELARGGMGVVYVAHDPELDREVAIKQCLPLKGAGSDTQYEEQQRFLREAKAVARLQHPHIVSVFDVGFADDASYIVMDLIQGESLQDRLKRDGPLGQREVARVGVQVAQALEYAHQRSILHRDVKPHNVLLSEEGEPKLTDFGLAKVADLRDLETQVSLPPGERAALPNLADDASLTVTGALLGTPAFMAPEQAEGKAVDARADIYSLGATLYALLTGGPPHGRSTVINTLHAVLHKPVVPPSTHRADLDRGLEAVVMRCLARDPAERYPTCQAVAAALSGWLKAPAAPAPSRSASTLPLLAGAGVAALAIGLGIALRKAPTPTTTTAAAPTALAAPTLIAKTVPLAKTTAPPTWPSPTPTHTPKPVPTPKPAPTDDPAVEPTPSPSAIPGRLRLEESFSWRAGPLHPWGQAPLEGERIFVLVGRSPDKFIRINRGGKRPPPVWKLGVGRVVPLRRKIGRVALATSQLFILRIGKKLAELREVESGQIRLTTVKHFSQNPANAALSDAWIVQAYETSGRWKLVARSTSANPDFDHLIDTNPDVSSVQRVLIGERTVGVLSGDVLLVKRLPTESDLTDKLSSSDRDPSRVNFSGGNRIKLKGKRPLAISPRDDLIAYRLPNGRGLQLYELSPRSREKAWLKKTTCADGERTAQFSPDGKLFAWVDGTVHVVAVDKPQQRVSVPKQDGWVAFFWHADTSITVCTPTSVRRYELRR